MKKPFVHPKEKFLLCILTTLLIANLATIHISVASSDETKLYVDPPSIVDPTLTPGSFFSINVAVANVTDLYGFEFKLCYNTTILTGLGVIIVPFPNQTDYTSNASINDEKGIILVSVRYRSPAKPLTTTDPVTLARIFFLVTAVGRTNLDLSDTKLVNDKAALIDHSVEDGYFKNLLLPPAASFTYSPLLPLVDETVTFNASASYDPDGTIVNYAWDFGDGNTGAGKVTTHKYTTFGTHNVTLTVTDDDGLTDTTWAIVQARKLPFATFTYSPAVLLVNQMVTFNASLSTPNGGTIVSYKWNFGDGTPLVTEADPVANHTYTAAGTYNVTLTVTDDEGLTNATTKSVTIAKLSSNISISAIPETIKVGETTTISGFIDPVRAGVTVTIHYRLSGEVTWNTTTVTTNSTGGYSYTWTPDNAGTYEVKASWNGDENTEPAESDHKNVTVEEAPAAPPYPLYLIAVIAIVVLAATAIYYLKKKR